jgi:hypothetical protein
MPYGLPYDPGEGVNFIHGSLSFSHYMVPYVESLLRLDHASQLIACYQYQ